jgi:hypothetical protein
MKEALGSSETSVCTRATRRNIPEDTILHGHRREKPRSYITLSFLLSGTGVNDWWDNWDKQIAFCRGDKGFIAFNNQYNADLQQTLQVRYITESAYKQNCRVEEARY